MKWFLKSADAQQRLDNPIYNYVLQHIPGRVDDEANADVILVPVYRLADYQFNSLLLRNKRPAVIIDTMELEWNAAEKLGKSLIFGENGRSNLYLANNSEWLKFDEWCAFNDQHICCYFKRELFAKQASDRIRPIEYPVRVALPAIQSKQDFLQRRFEVMHVWGYSHPSRVELGARILQGMARDGISVVTEWRQLAGLPDSERNTWISLYSPYWSREPLENVIALQQKSKVSVSLYGAGRKSFRDGEACVGALMARPVDDYAWSYPWTEGNSIQLQGTYDEVFQRLCDELSSDDLYDRYVACQHNAANYESRKYAKDYILNAIKERL